MRCVYAEVKRGSRPRRGQGNKCVVSKRGDSVYIKTGNKKLLDTPKPHRGQDPRSANAKRDKKTSDVNKPAQATETKIRAPVIIPHHLPDPHHSQTLNLNSPYLQDVAHAPDVKTNSVVMLARPSYYN